MRRSLREPTAIAGRPVRRKLPGRWQTGLVTKSPASHAQGDQKVAPATTSEDELIRRVTAERASGRDTAGEIDALLSVAAEKNRAALDRLAK